MARPKTDYRNEVKTRLKDRTYDALRAYMDLHGIDSESKAVADVMEKALLGLVGSVPAALLDHSHEMSHAGPKTSV